MESVQKNRKNKLGLSKYRSDFRRIVEKTDTQIEHTYCNVSALTHKKNRIELKLNIGNCRAEVIFGLYKINRADDQRIKEL